MKLILLTLTTVALVIVSPAAAQIYTGHWDIAAHEHIHGGETELELELHNHDASPPEEPLQGAIIAYNFGANDKVDVTVGYSNNLGLLYVSPATEAEADSRSMPFIGFSAEELPASFTGTEVAFTMTGFSFAANSFTVGPGIGKFYMFENIDLFFDSTAGPGNYGSFSVGAGTHGHGEFGFSDAGLYEITLVASGNNGASVSGDPATFTFNVVPEPSSGALLLAGMAALAGLRRRIRRPVQV